MRSLWFEGGQAPGTSRDVASLASYALGLACGTGYVSGADVSAVCMGYTRFRGADKARSPDPIFSRRFKRPAL